MTKGKAFIVKKEKRNLFLYIFLYFKKIYYCFFHARYTTTPQKLFFRSIFPQTAVSFIFFSTLV